MARIVAIANQKGGVGKTTTALNLAASLGAAERKILLIDIDPQGNATSGLGVMGEDLAEKQIYQVLLGERNVEECIRSTVVPNLEILPSTGDLIGFEIEAIDLEKRESRLKEALKTAQARYDVILIDCPPSLGLLTVNALTASDGILIPLQCEYFALEGLSRLLNTIELFRKQLNPSLALDGIVLTMFDKRNNLAHQVAKEVEEHFPASIWKTIIPRNVRLSEAPSFGKPILLYDIKSPGAQSYLSLAEEFLQRLSIGKGVDHERTESIGTGPLVADSHLPATGN